MDTGTARDAERTDWLDKGFDADDGRFLMLTAITHHRFHSAAWTPEDVAKLAAELREIEAALESTEAAAGPAKLAE